MLHALLKLDYKASFSDQSQTLFLLVIKISFANLCIASNWQYQLQLRSELMCRLLFANF